MYRSIFLIRLLHRFLQNRLHLIASNSNKLSVVVLLYLSSTFDTVDHHILLEWLHTRFGFRDSAFSWIQSFLRDRTSRVSVNSCFSRVFDFLCGVPQGSRTTLE